MNGFHIHIQGRVQGVGFRPFVYRLATKRNYCGWVKNALDGVHINIFSSDDIPIDAFLSELSRQCPAQARIERIDYNKIQVSEEFEDFKIIHAKETGPVNMVLTPDFAVCEDCRKELLDQENRRYFYAFITCTNCGPRYSIISRMPYDRPFTTMARFHICENCDEEYKDPLDRRFYSQTNSCPECPVSLSLYHSNGEQVKIPENSIIKFISDKIKKGKIIAVKGIGGYLLLTDACSASALKNLRDRKRRPSKPFALMYPDPQKASEDVMIHQDILSLWKSPESPIVLCHLKNELKNNLQLDLIAQGLDRLGIMMPYTPLFLLLMNEINSPLVATSGNVSGSPIIFRDDEAFLYFKNIADYILTNDRDIVVPQDDSVVQFSEKHGQKIVLRRSRGIAPGYELRNGQYHLPEPVFASGAMLKSAFGLYHQDRFYISQFLGDTSELESLESYESVAGHLFNVLEFKPSVVLTDQHPDYPVTQYGKDLAGEYNTKIMSVQHHKAHAFAVLAENELLHENDILCIIWDGTGLGEDQQIWGGEFFHYKDKELDRTGHWDYFSNIAGDRMALEPAISALSLCSSVNRFPDGINEEFSEIEWKNLLKIAAKPVIKTSSTGRLFDGIAYLLGFAEQNSYEGEAAMKLEAAARFFYKMNRNYSKSYKIQISDRGMVITSDLISDILNDMEKGVDKKEIAFKFHLSLVEVVRNFAKMKSCEKIVFSGGVFQNSLMVDILFDHLSDNHKLYFHRDLSPNDECIAFGQMMAYYIKTEKEKLTNKSIVKETINH